MAPPLATPEELRAYLQRDVPEDTAVTALTLASGKVRGYINRSLAILADATTAPDDVRAVVVAVASRVCTNPNDIRQEAVGSESLTYGAETIGVQLTGADKTALSRYRRRFWTVTTPIFPGVVP